MTFLFTDIEGSTRLVQALGDRYSDLLADHCRIVRAAIADGGGIELGTEGDSFFAVFPTAEGGLRATAAAQRELARHPWPDGVSVRVRMGLHTGEGKLGGENYVGLDVHRAARIAAAGHGGQIVVSDATRSMVAAEPPAGTSFRELGAHRLKDLAAPERLYQLVVPGLPNEFPALRTLDARANNLPVQLTSFIGRETEIAAVGELLDRARLVTLTGPGGTGKTRLALQVAAERLVRYADGAYVVELAPISEPDLVVSAIASALSVREATDQSLIESLHEALRDREMLLVLDNFEQVLDAAALVGDLLGRAPRLRILVTSRAVLRVHGEHEYPVPPLRIPDPASLPALEALSAFEGVALFIERAMATRPDFAVTVESAPAVAEIVARLDGLPLAIELAAAKSKVLGPEAILGRLGSRLAFLGGGPRDLPARQQTLRQAIDWSFRLLSAGEQSLARRLGVFVGGAMLDAVEAVARPAELGLEPLEAMTGLVDQSLVRRDEAAHDEPRFSMLETIREFALERLAEVGELDETRRRHADHYLAVAEAEEPRLTQTADAGHRVDHDHDNFRAALAWAIETGDADVGLRLGFALWRFWQQRGHLREGREWFDRLLAIPGATAATAARARGLTGAAGIAYWQNDYAAAEAWYTEAEQIVRQLGDRVWLTDAIYNSGTVAGLRGDMELVAEKFREGQAIARELGDDAILGRFLEGEGYMAFMGDDLARARRLLEEALALASRRGDRMAIGLGHHTVAQVARLDGRLDDAAAHYREAVRIGHEMGDAAALSEPLQGLAAVAVARGRGDEGRPPPRGQRCDPGAPGRRAAARVAASRGPARRGTRHARRGRVRAGLGGGTSDGSRGRRERGARRSSLRRGSAGPVGRAASGPSVAPPPARRSRRFRPVTEASSGRRPADIAAAETAGHASAPRRPDLIVEDLMRRLMLAATAGLLAVTAFAAPVGARDFGAVYANDLVYRVFGNAANVPDGTGTDPFAKFTNSTNGSQFGVAEFAPGSPTGHHGGRWAVYRATWTTGDPSTLVTSWDQLEAYAASGALILVRDAAADFRCPVLGNPEPIG